MTEFFAGILASFIALFGGGDVQNIEVPELGGPPSRLERTMIPETDSVYFLGTSSPSVIAWARVIADAFYDTDASDGCATFSSNLLTSTGVPCGSGGGSGGGTWSTTTSQVSGTLINYPNNASDVVAIGSNATTSAEFWFDPNTTKARFGTTGASGGSLTVGTSTVLANLGVWGSGNNIFRILNTSSTTVLRATDYGATTTNLTVETNASTTNITVSALNAASCDVKASTAGVLSCGTDATGGSSGNVATSSAETSGRVPFWTSTAATPATLSGGSANLTWNNTTNLFSATYASTTGLSSSYASSTEWRGGGLDTDCDTSATSKLLWDSTTGKFSCGSDQSGGGAGGGTWSTTTSQVSGELINYSNNTSDIVVIGSNSSTTAEFYFDPNTVTAVFGNGSAGDSSLTFGPNVSNQWIIGYDDTDKSFAIASSTVIGTSNVLRIDKGGLLTLSSGLIASASSTINGNLNIIGNATATNATTTNFNTTKLRINSEEFTDLTGTGLQNVSGALAVATTTTTLFTGMAGQVLAYTNIGWTGVATTTFGTGLTYSGGNVTCNTASASVFGCLSSSDWSTFNSKLGSYNAFTNPTATSFATTSGMVINNASSTFVGNVIITGNSTTTNATTTSFAILNLTAASCDVKASATGVLSCGTDMGGADPFPGFATTSQLVFNSASSTFTGVLNLTRASSTLWSSLYASSTEWRGGGLDVDCDGDAQALGWDITTGKFTCGDDDSGGAASAGGSDTQIQFNDGGSSIGGAIGFVWDKAKSFVGIGSTTPYAILSVASSTYKYLSPLFVVSTSSSPLGNLFSVHATTSTLGFSSQLPQGTVTSYDTGARVRIGGSNGVQFNGTNGSTGGLDQLEVDGRINTGDWLYTDCTISASQLFSVTSDAGSACGSFQFQIDTNGTFGQASSPITSLQLTISSAAGTGAGLFASNNTSWKIATSTPIIETSISPRVAGAAGFGTSTLYIGFTNLDPTGTSFETQPTSGCYITASSTQMNYRAVCVSSSTYTIVDTPISTSTDYFIRFRIETSSSEARFYYQTPTTTMSKFATISTNIPSTTFLVPGIYVAKSTGGIASAVSYRLQYIRLWWRTTLWGN